MKRFQRAVQVYDSDTMAKLQQVFDTACYELGIEPSLNDTPDEHFIRERLASAIFRLAEAGVLDLEQLRIRALDEIRNQMTAA
jgi:hypothetical protein